MLVIGNLLFNVKAFKVGDHVVLFLKELLDFVLLSFNFLLEVLPILLDGKELVLNLSYSMDMFVLLEAFLAVELLLCVQRTQLLLAEVKDSIIVVCPGGATTFRSVLCPQLVLKQGIALFHLC